MFDKKHFEVYLDMDGVFADFEKGAAELFDGRHKEVEKKHFWGKINKNPDFFYNLEKLDGADALMHFMISQSPSYVKFAFLTGAPPLTEHRAGKIKWVRENYNGIPTIVLPRKEKRLYAHASSLLIDDSEDLIEQWVEAGGIGIHHDGDYDKTVRAYHDHVIKPWRS